MLDMVVIGQFERRLVELGCPAAKLREKVRELADHYEDLRLAALEEGVSEKDAKARADAQLGDTVQLAEKIVAVLRQSSWWGRHPIIGFCWLPLFAFTPAWLLCGGILAGLCWLMARLFGPTYNFDAQALDALRHDSGAFNTFASPVNAALTFFAVLLSGLLFLWLARRSALGLKWMVLTCAITSANSFFVYSTIQPGSVAVGYALPSPNWIFAATPLVIAGAALFRQRKVERCLAPIPSERRSKICGSGETSRFWRTPTYWVTTVVGIGFGFILAVGIAAYVSNVRESARKVELKTKLHHRDE
jgi:hypothetical protein